MSVWPCKYRHNDETVEAFRWTGAEDQREEPLWAVDALHTGRIRIVSGGTVARRLEVKTRGGMSSAMPGDWIVRRASGELEVATDILFRKRCAVTNRVVPKKGQRADRPRPGALRAQ